MVGGQAIFEDLGIQLENVQLSDLGRAKKIVVDKATFDKMHAENRMAHDKLKEGIEGFSKALEDLEKLLEKRLSELPKPQAVSK